MPDYQKLYTMLFNSITDALECLADGSFEETADILIKAQQNAEEEYIDNC